MPIKQHTSKALQDFHCYVQTQFNRCIKSIWTYNGREFVNTELSSFFSKFGILHQTTCPYTPQKNGRIGWRHRNLFEMTKTLVFQSHLLTSFWGDCLLTSTYLINRLPNSKLNFETPYVKLFKEPHDYISQAFGCLAYMSLHSSDILVVRALKTIFSGCPANQKFYKLYDPLTSTIHVSIHVVFDKHSFLSFNFLHLIHLFSSSS